MCRVTLIVDSRRCVRFVSLQNFSTPEGGAMIPSPELIGRLFYCEGLRVDMQICTLHQRAEASTGILLHLCNSVPEFQMLTTCNISCDSSLVIWVRGYLHYIPHLPLESLDVVQVRLMDRLRLTDRPWYLCSLFFFLFFF